MEFTLILVLSQQRKILFFRFASDSRDQIRKLASTSFYEKRATVIVKVLLLKRPIESGVSIGTNWFSRSGGKATGWRTIYRQVETMSVLQEILPRNCSFPLT